ncbi:MAG: hypothetical protein ACRDXX_06400, partial [Stackebrandtia sp.]
MNPSQTPRREDLTFDASNRREWADLLRTAEAKLAEAGVDTPRNDAELLAAHAAGIARAALLTAPPPEEE